MPKCIEYAFRHGNGFTFLANQTTLDEIEKYINVK